MPSKKHRPIVMNRHKKRSRSGTIIKRVLLVIAVIALIEIVIVYFFVNTKKETIPPASTAQQKPASIKKEVQKDTPKIVTQKIAPIEQPEIIENTDTFQTAKPAVTPTTSPTETIQPEKKAVTPKPSITPPVKKLESELTNEKMSQILNDIRLEKLKANNAAKCIQVRITNTSNVANGFKVVDFLKSNGYIISGREVISATLDGVNIDANGPCIKLTIGNL